MNISKAELEQLYVGDNKSIHEISRIFSCRSLQIIAKLKQYKILFRQPSKEVLSDLYIRESKTIQELSQKFGVSRDQVYIWLKAYSITLRKLYIPSKEELQEMYCKQNIQYTDICKHFNISSTRLFKLLNKYKLKKYSRKLPDNILLTDEQSVIIFGSLLGDGYARYSSNKATFSFKQCRKKAAYVRWLRNRLKPFSSDIRYTTDTSLKDTHNKVYYKVSFDTHVHYEFVRFVDMFYSSKKHVPSNDFLSKYLTPLALAVWYMDDGSAHCAKLATLGFSKDDVERLVGFLNKTYKLEARTAYSPNDGGNGYNIVCNTREFFKLVTPYVKLVPCMYYKLPKYAKNS